MYQIIKRLVGIVASMLARIILSPLLFVAAIRIEISDPGPPHGKLYRKGNQGH